MAAPQSFQRVDYPEPHRERTRKLLSAHPEAKELQGHVPGSALIVAGLVAFQLGVAWLLRDQPLWLVVVAAWFIGALADHALWVLIHEATHNLVFRGSAANSWVAILANLPILFPGAMGFRKYHLLHHAYQGREDLDADLASPSEARLVGNAWWRKALWLLLYFAVQALRVPRLKTIRLLDGWYLVNLAVQVGFVVAVATLGGWTALAYLFFASAFAIGLHPVGARWIQEHYLTFPGSQETFSYYGPMNLLALNVGYHNEHHDLMRVPWTRLPRLKALAPELYQPLHSHRSWTALLLRFLFDPSLSLYSRVTRAPASPGAARPEPAAP
jgi:sphingolipid delta-4 desaturase